MLELTVNSKSAASITAALKKIREMVKSGAVSSTAAVHLILEPGTYTETIRYNLSNPLVMESASGTKAENCVIQAENCESFHKGAENRAVFVLGQNVTSVTLKNFSIINTHNKSILDGNTAGDSAEALCWENSGGTLFAEGMRFEGHQNTLTLKGFSHFKKCYVSGDVDVISGIVDTALFEDCTIYLREDNRGDYNAYAVKSYALAQKTGFVFLNCSFTGEKRRKAALYVMRTAGKGSAMTMLGWDSVALINCQVNAYYDEELSWDDDHSLTVYPRANAKYGWREYNTTIVNKNGEITPADTSRRNVKAYLLTESDYFAGYASRFLILNGTPLVKE